MGDTSPPSSSPKCACCRHNAHDALYGPALAYVRSINMPVLGVAQQFARADLGA